MQTLVDPALMTSHLLDASPQLGDPTAALIVLAIPVIVVILMFGTLRRAMIVISGDDAGRLVVRMLMFAIIIAFILAVIATGYPR